MQSDFNEVDKFGTEYNGLATDLLELLFKREMLTPEDYCCTQSKGKTLLNQELLRGIRCKLTYSEIRIIMSPSTTNFTWVEECMIHVLMYIVFGYCVTDIA